MRVELSDGRSYIIEHFYELPREEDATGLWRAAHVQGSHHPGQPLPSPKQSYSLH